MHAPAPRHDRRQTVIRIWLTAVAALIFAMVLVGGATRLTESGLSIVEWQPVIGVVPPLNHGEWQTAFNEYQKIPQYSRLNEGMSLNQFKNIYWWEWSHRLLGRVIGLAFLLPFLWFLWRGWIRSGLRWRLWTIFGLGAFQGAVGWWMVASGLTHRINVSQYRLAFHLTLACLIFTAILWTAQQLRPRDAVAPPRRLTITARVLVVLVLIQIYLGALVAGLHAGYIYNTWPLIDGGFVPKLASLFHEAPWWRNFFENTLTVQFDHRMMAYTIWLIAVLHFADALRNRCSGAMLVGAATVVIAVTVQAILGIVTLLHAAPLALALAHQGTAMVVLTVAIVHAERAGTPAAATVSGTALKIG